jgi:hypothetical protein
MQFSDLTCDMDNNWTLLKTPRVHTETKYLFVLVYGHRWGKAFKSDLHWLILREFRFLCYTCDWYFSALDSSSMNFQPLKTLLWWDKEQFMVLHIYFLMARLRIQWALYKVLSKLDTISIDNIRECLRIFSVLYTSFHRRSSRHTCAECCVPVPGTLSLRL